jgi:hypothetical protein
VLAGEIGAVDERVLNRHRELAALPELQLHAEAVKVLRYELDLPADERRGRVISRLRAWLLLETTEARRIATVFGGAIDDLEPEERETVRETEEDAVMDGLSYYEFQRLRKVMPSLRKWDVPAWQTDPAGVFGIPGSLAAALAWAGIHGEL